LKLGFVVLLKSLFSLKVLDVCINNVEQDAFGLSIHFLDVVNAIYDFFVIRSVFPFSNQKVCSNTKGFGHFGNHFNGWRK
ncbi:hypothetical protein, partial [Pedobacter gandavensis]|uniref:hypothetical protein n=1 Tax=Pedobacter gandavensis TaxID=2679963 RepID=UPI00292D243E